MFKDGNVKHLVKKIISVYTMHWSALKMISIDALFPIWNDNVMTDFKKTFLVFVASKFMC